MIDAAVIGLGRWGKGIVESVQGKSRRLRIIRGVSKEPELVRDFAAAKGFELSTDFEEAIGDPRVKAVFLATPHSLHVAQIGAVAAAGKSVWCEKPLALTRAEAERAIAAVTRAKVVLGLGNNKRCFASMRELKRIVASGAIGDGVGEFRAQFETVGLGEIGNELGLFAHAANKAQALALALHRFDDGFAPASQPDDGGIDHRKARCVGCGRERIAHSSHARNAASSCRARLL